jgi:transcriptional regulator with XRE-family HTH domain
MKPKKITESFDEVSLKMAEIGERVRQLRKAYNTNYEDFAKSKNINKVTLNRLERGDNVSLKLFLSVLIKLDISLDEFSKGL